MVLSQDIMRQKAKQFWPDIYPGREVPQLSNGWLERFQARKDLKPRRQNIRDAEESAEDITIEMIRVRQILRAFAPQNIFSCDETGLFWRMTPERSSATRDSKREQARMSALFCCNADASERLPILFIGTTQQPASFSKAQVNIENLGCHWRSNNQAWMTSDIFKEWLLWFDAQMSGRQVVLLLDKLSAHQIAVQKYTPRLQNTLVVWLPKSSTSQHQPLEKGILYTWKAYWKREWIRYMLMEFERGVHPSMTMTVLTAIRWSIAAWNVDLDSDTIVKSFKNALEVEKGEEIDNAHLHLEISSILHTLSARNFIPNVIDINKFLDSADEKVTDDVIDIDSVVLSQFTSSEDAGEEEEDGLTESIPRISHTEALRCIQTLRLYEEQQDHGNKELIQVLLRNERTVQQRANQDNALYSRPMYFQTLIS